MVVRKPRDGEVERGKRIQNSIYRIFGYMGGMAASTALYVYNSANPADLGYTSDIVSKFVDYAPVVFAASMAALCMVETYQMRKV